MTQTLEEGMKNQSKCIKVPREIRPFDIGYRIVNKYGQALALRNGASIFDLPFLAEKAIEKEFGKNDPELKKFLNLYLLNHCLDNKEVLRIG